MSRKLMLSSIAIAATATLLGVGTFAKYSDKEDSSKFNVTAGTMDLVVTGAGFVVNNVVPGSSSAAAETTGQEVTFENQGDVAGNLTVKVVLESNTENGHAEPEAAWDTWDSAGELADSLYVKIGNVTENKAVKLSSLIDLGPFALGSLAAGADGSLMVDWYVPVTAGNEIMTDGVSFHLEFELQQV